MAYFVIWTDSDHAKVFKLSSSGTQEETVKRHGQHGAGGHHNKGDKSNEDHFFHDICKHLQGAEEILIVGPGLAKTHLKHHFDSHHAHDLAKKVVGVESLDHPTEGQIVAFGKKFFKVNHDFFN